MVIAINRWDMVNARKINVDLDRLSELLGAPIVTTVATTGEGLEDLKSSIIKAAHDKKKPKAMFDYGNDVETGIRSISAVLNEKPELLKRYPQRWLAIKLIERDERVLEKTKSIFSGPQIAKILEVIGHV